MLVLENTKYPDRKRKNTEHRPSRRHRCFTGIYNTQVDISLTLSSTSHSLTLHALLHSLHYTHYSAIHTPTVNSLHQKPPPSDPSTVRRLLSRDTLSRKYNIHSFLHYTSTLIALLSPDPSILQLLHLHIYSVISPSHSFLNYITTYHLPPTL